jgi:hypothetical protein
VGWVGWDGWSQKMLAGCLYGIPFRAPVPYLHILGEKCNVPVHVFFFVLTVQACMGKQHSSSGM